MVALESRLRERREAGAKLLVPYVTAGLTPDWTDLLRAVADAGADAVEVGIPFSDPMVDGPTIQAASTRALANGVTPRSVLAELATVDAGVPLVVMTYYNLVFRAGHRRFARWLAEAGVDGTILPDLPLELAGDWIAEADEAGVENVLLVAPITTSARARQLAEASRGFVYAVSTMGTTGERTEMAATATSVAERVKAVTDRPVLVGFGVSTPDHAVSAAGPADGVIVASALMRQVLDGAGIDAVVEVVAGMRRALDAAYSPQPAA